MPDEAKSWDRSRKPVQERCSVVVTTKITPVEEARLDKAGVTRASLKRSGFVRDAISEKLDRVLSDSE